MLSGGEDLLRFTRFEWGCTNQSIFLLGTLLKSFEPGDRPTYDLLLKLLPIILSIALLRFPSCQEVLRWGRLFRAWRMGGGARSRQTVLGGPSVALPHCRLNTAQGRGGQAAIPLGFA